MTIKAGAIVGASWLALAGAAAADPATDARVQQLEQRLEELQSQLNDLKESSSADVADIRTQAASQPTVTLANGRPTIATPDGNFKFALRGVAQFDVANYLQDDDGRRLVAAQGGDLSSGANFRRARFGFEGTAFKVWNYALTYEGGGSGNEASGLQQAYLEYAGWKPFGLTAPVRFRIGSYAVENTLEGATSNTDQIFLERPAVADVVRSAFGGDGRNAFGIYANGDRLFTSVFVTGGTLSNADVGSSGEVHDEGWGYVARIAALPIRGEDYSVHIGANYSAISQLGDPNGTTGPDGSIQFRERPELRVDASSGSPASSLRLVDTGAIVADSARAYGVELAGQWRNFYLAGEWLNIDVDRSHIVAGDDPNVGDPSFSGWYVQGAWTITGERRAWNASTGGYGGIKPTNNFDLNQGHWGAFEVAARYSVLDLNDNEGEVDSAVPLGGIRGGEQTISSIGLNWYPNSVVRFLLDFQNVDVDRISGGTVNATTNPVANADIGQSYQAIALRTQVAF
jgi:phosphate-selective porin OprO/OprP